jgi:hypothetical protein
MLRLSLAALALLACLGIARSVAVSEEPPASEAEKQKQMAEMMKKMADAGKLGEHHKGLEYFLGAWDGEVVFPGMSDRPSKVSGEGAWVIPGRWMSWKSKGALMGMPSEMFTLFGYDNTKKGFVSTTVSSMDTSMIHTHGTVVDPTGKISSQYGTLDEYLTGEHDKPIRVTTKQLSQDQFVREIWDLGIGELGAVVIRYTFTRRK